MAEPLSLRLKRETARLHALVERSGVMPLLLRGELSPRDYCRLLANLHAVYVELESGLERYAADARLAPVYLPALFRHQAIAADLDVLAGAGGPESLPLTDATVRYRKHLRRLAESEPQGLAAHAYVRYLGDLYGGRVVARAAARCIARDDDRGLCFYDFGDAAQVRELRQALRSGLDALPCDHLALVAEAKNAFERHRALFTELCGEREHGTGPVAPRSRARSGRTQSV